MDLAQAFTASIESALNRYLSLDPQALSRCSQLEGKVIAIEFQGLNTSFSLFPSAEGFLVFTDFDGQADAIISGTPLALIKLFMADQSKDIIFKGEVEISGDTHLASQFNNLLSQLDIDWEEILAQNIGDLSAHKIGNIFRDANQWLKRSVNSVYMDAGEYLQEEARLSPSNAELRHYIKLVDELREATDRLSAKIQIIKSRPSENDKK